MLLVKTYIAPSEVHGIGLFAGEFIKRKSGVCKFRFSFDKSFNGYSLEGLQKEFIHHYGYLEKGIWRLNSDNMRFCNHSKEPNLECGFDVEVPDIAIRDISINEELTIDYSTFDESWKERLNIK